MPLISHEIVGHDEKRLAFKFSMLNDGQVVQCQISDLALDTLAGDGRHRKQCSLGSISLPEANDRNGGVSPFRLFRGSVVKIFAKHVAGGPCEAAPNR
jgi:hypothetical protein